MPSSISRIIPWLLRDNAFTSSGGRTRRRSTSRGTLTPWRAPSILIQLQRLLWMWAAIIPTVNRGIPGTGFDHTSRGRCSTRNTVARLFVRHAAIRLPASALLATRAPLQTRAHSSLRARPARLARHVLGHVHVGRERERARPLK